MPTIRLTDRGVSALRVEKRTDFWDATEPAFGVRVSPAGTRTFVYRYRHGGQKKRLTIGRYPQTGLAEARRVAKEAAVCVAKGIDPADPDGVQGAMTWGELAHLYIERHAKPKKRTWKEDARILDRDVPAGWRDVPVHRLDRSRVVRVVDRVVDRGSPVMANRVRSVLSKAFAFAIERGVIDRNPLAGTRPPTVERPADRVLDDAEIRRLWQVWTQEDSITSAIFRMMLVTAQRPGEVCSMRWDQVDGRWWTIPAEVAKNKRAHRVYLSDLALEIVERVKPRTQRFEHVFASGRRGGEPVTWIYRAASRYRKRSGVSNWSPRDLRRTAATGIGRLGFDFIVIGRVLNHAPEGAQATPIYNRATYEPVIEEALRAWGDRLEHVVTS